MKKEKLFIIKKFKISCLLKKIKKIDLFILINKINNNVFNKNQ